MIDAEFVNAIAELAQKAQSPSILETPLEPYGRYRIAHPDGKVELIETPGPAQKRKFTTLQSLFEWAWTGADYKPKAWVALDQIKVTWEDPRFSFGTFDLGLSLPMAAMAQMEKNVQSLDQKSLIKLLRHSFADCVPATLVNVFRQLKLVRNEEQQASYQLTSSNVGKRIEASLTGPSAIPEEIVFNLPMIRDPFIEVESRFVRCQVDVEPTQGLIALVPVPGQVVAALRAAETQLFGIIQNMIVSTNPEGVPEDVDSPKAVKSALTAFPAFQGKAE